ncbi:VanZ family protein [Adlercreutzia sp. ZJ473]|uniref:VanZ family protein n=1 Tax=Adlercreutzia sp. ZJ473 TaxID=2722822 RepID=UPI0015529724|nr:VanZ family protein [Adlercreutzia sp. ZJ473]
MDSYISDIKFGMLTFPLIAFLLSLPYALWQYRRFGSISVWKTFVVFSFAFYCLCACYLVVLPLPPDRGYVNPSTQSPQLDPFYLIQSIRASTDFSLLDRTTWAATLKTPCVYEAIFNVMLTMPLGAFLLYLFRCRWYHVLLIGFATTLLFETSQLTGLFGIYEHPYRLFDVDDLVLNTAGAMLGFWLAIPFCWALPGMDEVDDQSRERGLARVSAARRLAGFTVDVLVTAALFLLAWLVLQPSELQVAKALAVDPSRAAAKGFLAQMLLGMKADPVGALLVLSAAACVTFGVIPAVTRGRTLGHALVGLRIVRPDGSKAPWYAPFARYGTLGLFASAPLWFVALVPSEIEGVGSATLVEMIAMVYGLWVVSLVVRAVGSLFGLRLTMLNEVVSGTRLLPSKAASPDLRQGPGQPPRQTYPASSPTAPYQPLRQGPSRNLQQTEPFRSPHRP